jgi:tetratricopeptide (TPR) repeat protein
MLGAVGIPDELARARTLAYTAHEDAARDVLVSLIPEIEQADRDDLLLEVFAQLGDIYLIRGANDGVAECIRRITDCLDIYRAILAGARPDLAAQVSMSDLEINHMVCRHRRRAEFLTTGLAAAHGDHELAEAALARLAAAGAGDAFPGLVAEHRALLTQARVRCAVALAADDLYSRALPLWLTVIEYLQPGTDEAGDHLFVVAATEYGRYCVETGRLAEAQPWLSRAGARAEVRGWELAAARTRLERAAAGMSVGDHESAELLLGEAYPVIARYARAHDVSRCWLYFGLLRLAIGRLDEADECWASAEKHGREEGAPLHLHRILLQRSWAAVFQGDHQRAVELVESARSFLESAPRHSWLQSARLDSHLGTVWRAAALADLGFDASDPQDLGTIDEPRGSTRYRTAMDKLEHAADLKIPAALAVDSVRYSITDAAVRAQWATRVAAPLWAGAFAVAWEWENTDLTGQLIEYHSARGMLATTTADAESATTATESLAIDHIDGPIELGPLPTLQMDSGSPPILGRYRALAQQRYGTQVTADLPGWTTWP